MVTGEDMRTEVEQYQNLLTTDYPMFIEKYLKIPCMLKLKTRGQFCGVDYTKIFPVRYWYTRFDHSVVCALMTWHFTHDKTKTIASLLHDLGTPAFSHCIDYVKGDYEKQESSELDLKELLLSSKEILACLKEDQIAIENIIPLQQHSIVDIERPGICVDRLDGVLHTNLIWLSTWNLSDISNVYSGMKVLKNENGKEEIGFSDVEIAEQFYLGAHTYSMVLQQNEDRFIMQFIADVLKELVAEKLLSVDDFYQLSEDEIIQIIEQSKLGEIWSIFRKTKSIERSNSMPEDSLYTIECFETKKRYVIPLCEYCGNIIRLNEISSLCSKLLQEYQTYRDSNYAYIKRKL